MLFPAKFYTQLVFDAAFTGDLTNLEMRCSSKKLALWGYQEAGSGLLVLHF